MRKFLTWTGIILGVLLLALVLIPFLFKDKINELIRKQINEQVNAEVYYGDYSLSLIRHFPKITFTVSDLGIVNKEPFLGDTLLSAAELGFSMDIMSVIRGDKIDIRSIDIDQPRIKVRILADGRANYDIVKSDSTQVEETDTSSVSISIEQWTISQGHIEYYDQPGKIKAVLDGIEHSGSGDIESSLYDLVTRTRIASASVSSDGTEYLSGRRLEADITLGMDMDKSIYTFKNNRIQLNEFPLIFEGSIAMPDTNIGLDLKFSTPENSFKNLLSLIPAAYGSSFSDLKAEGQIAFSGFAKGVYNAVSYPAFELITKIDKGSFQYSGLPLPVKDVQLDLSVSNKSSDLEDLLIDARQLKATIGKDRIEARARVQGLSVPDIDAQAAGKLDLAALTQAFPMEGMTLKGSLGLDVSAKGQYGGGRFPVTRASLDYKDGYIKSTSFPEPIDQLQFKGTITNTSGQMADTDILIDILRFSLQGKPFEASGRIHDLDNYNWDIRAKGEIDLAKITRIVPVAGMELGGLIAGNISSKGVYSDVEAGRYDKIPTSGSIKVDKLSYASPDLAHPVLIEQALVDFTPQALQVRGLSGKAGKSDFSASGQVNNYMKYVMDPNAPMSGSFDVRSRLLDLNEWMGAPAAATSSTGSGVLAIPKNLNFSLRAAIDRVLYSDMEIKNVSGTVSTDQGVARLDNARMQTMGGSFSMSGHYDTRDLNKPGFNFNMGLDQLSIPETSQKLSIVKTYMPVANQVLGTASGDFRVSGLLGQDMSPVMSSIDASGLVRILSASLASIPALNKLVELTKLKSLDQMDLKNLILKLKIKDGLLTLDPVDIKIKDQYKMNLGGTTALDGGINYKVVLDVPSGKAGQAFNDVFQKYSGKKLSGTETVSLDVLVGGTYAKPTLKLGKSSTANTVKDAVVDLAKEKADEARAKAEAEAAKFKKEAEDRIKAEQEKLRQEAEAKKKELEAKAKAEADRLKKQAEDKAKKEADKAGKKLENEAGKLLKGLGKKSGDKKD